MSDDEAEDRKVLRFPARKSGSATPANDNPAAEVVGLLGKADRVGLGICIDETERDLVVYHDGAEEHFDIDKVEEWLSSWARTFRRRDEHSERERFKPVVHEILFCAWWDWKKLGRLNVELLTALRQMKDGLWQGSNEPMSILRGLSDRDKRHLRDLMHEMECRKLRPVGASDYRYFNQWCSCQRPHRPGLKLCKPCKGWGRVITEHGGRKQCPVCEGRGKVPDDVPMVANDQISTPSISTTTPASPHGRSRGTEETP